MTRRSTIASLRFGYGIRPGERGADGPDGLIAQIGAGAAARPEFASAPLEARVAMIRAIRDARKSGAAPEDLKILRRRMLHAAIRGAAEQVVQRARSPHGLFERLAAFWSDHFAIVARNPAERLIAPRFETDAIRPNLTGRFEDMLIAAVQHPAMLHALDQVQSFGPGSRAGRRRGRGLNENLAREVLELHTLGVGAAYTQADVREFAELLTGYATERGFAAFRFRPERAEPGAETVLGQRYGGGPKPDAADAEALLRDLARHSETALHLARKLAVHFVADRPDEDLVRHVAAAWRRHGGALMPVYAALVEHPASWRGLGAKVRRPAEVLAATLRATGTARADLDDRRARRLVRALRDLGQMPFRPPGPDGWPEAAAAWITPQGLAARLGFASSVGQRLARNADLDPRRFAETALGDALRPATRFAVGAAPERWEGFALALASPEFNRR